MLDFERKISDTIFYCGKSREIRDQTPENISYSKHIEQLCDCLKESINSGKPQQNLLAEKYCILFERNYCAVTQKEKDRLNDQLTKLMDAIISVKMATDGTKYRQFCKDSFIEIAENYLPYHGCSMFIKTQLDTLARSQQGAGIEVEKQLWELRRDNLKACRSAFLSLQKQALSELGQKTQKTGQDG